MKTTALTATSGALSKLEKAVAALWASGVALDMFELIRFFGVKGAGQLLKAQGFTV